MNQETTPQANQDGTTLFSKMAYGAFVLLALYFLLVNKSLGDFLIQFGIALVFDPFDQTVCFNERPLYQRIWMIVHLVVLLAAAVYHFFLSK